MNTLSCTYDNSRSITLPMLSRQPTLASDIPVDPYEISESIECDSDEEMSNSDIPDSDSNSDIEYELSSNYVEMLNQEDTELAKRNNERKKVQNLLNEINKRSETAVETEPIVGPGAEPIAETESIADPLSSIPPNLSDPPPLPLNQTDLLKLIKDGNEASLAQMLSGSTLKKSILEHCFKIACKEGYVAATSVFIRVGKIDVNMDDGFGLRLASKNGHTEIMQILLAHGADPTLLFNAAIRAAITNGKIGATKVLLNDSRTKFYDAENEAVLQTIVSNNEEMFALLINEYPPDLHFYPMINEMLHMIVKKNRYIMCNLILKDYRADLINNPDIMKIIKNKNSPINVLLNTTYQRQLICGTTNQRINDSKTNQKIFKKLFDEQHIKISDARIDFVLDGNRRKMVLQFDI